MTPSLNPALKFIYIDDCIFCKKLQGVGIQFMKEPTEKEWEELRPNLKKQLCENCKNKSLNTIPTTITT